VLHSIVRILLAGCVLVAATTVDAGTPRLESLTVSDSESGSAAASFAPDTPKLFLHASLVDVPAGSHLASVWIASDTAGVAPPNYKVDTVEMTTGANDVATFAVSRPADGWPAGSYIVDLFVNGTAAYKVQFKVRAP
jgi:hypothetical protein